MDVCSVTINQNQITAVAECTNEGFSIAKIVLRIREQQAAYFTHMWRDEQILRLGDRQDIVAYLTVDPDYHNKNHSISLLDEVLQITIEQVEKRFPNQRTLDVFLFAAVGNKRYWVQQGWTPFPRSTWNVPMFRRFSIGEYPNLVVSGPAVGELYYFLPASLVYAFEPLAANWKNTSSSSLKPVSEVARTRPKVGGWSHAVTGKRIVPSAIAAAIKKAESLVGAPFWKWEYQTSKMFPGNEYREDGESFYGFMAFYDWTQANGIDLNKLIDSQGEPLLEAIEAIAGRFATNEEDKARFVEWMSQWLNRRQGFIARHAAQTPDHPYVDDGRPTRQHLGLVMWAASPDLNGLKNASTTNP